MTENKKKQIDDVRLKSKLNDTQQQRGLEWRKQKLEAVAKARRRGYSERAIFVELKRAGLTNHTANRIMDDALYFDTIEYDESETPFMDYVKRREKEKEGKK